MNEETSYIGDKEIYDNSLKFFGAITASVSHELNNVISIIDQTGGLLDDLLYSADAGKPIPPGKLHSIVDKIAVQTDRGVRIIKRMNYFAHSIDDPIRQTDIIQLIDNFSQLMQRLASQKKIEIIASYSADPISVSTSPFLLELLLYYLIKSSFVSYDTERKLRIEASQSGGELIILVERLPDALAPNALIPQELSARLKCRLDSIRKENIDYYRLQL